MSPRPRESFAYQACAHAFSARFHRPVIHDIEALAATSLPVIGGHAQSSSPEFCLPRLVRFKSAHSHVSGSMEDAETATTQAITTIEGLNIMDVITADRVTARLTSQHKLTEPEGHILAIGSTYENLRIAGYEFAIILRHELLLNARTHADLAGTVAADEKAGKLASSTKDGAVLCSLVEEIKTNFPGLSDKDKRKHIIRIPHFGTLSFAEIIGGPGTKTLTMLRFDLGSPDGGLGTVTSAATNGKPSPPVTGGH